MIGKNFILKFLTVVAFTAISTGSVLAQSKWEFATAYSDTNYHTQVARSFSRAITICTGGMIEIDVFSGGQRFKSAEIKAAVEVAAVPLGEIFLSSHADEDPIFGIDSIPFLATDFDQSKKLYKAFRPAMSRVLDKSNLRLLYSVPWPPQGFYSDGPINDIGDLSEKGFFAYNKTTRRIAELSGMTIPSKVKVAELDYAIDQKKIQVLISSAATGHDRKIWDRLSHFYDVGGWLPRNYVVINKDTFNAEKPAVQNCILSAASLAQETGEAKAAQLARFYLDSLAENGMTVEKPSEDFAAELKLMGDSLKLEWIGQTGSAGQEILDAFEE